MEVGEIIQETESLTNTWFDSKSHMCTHAHMHLGIFMHLLFVYLPIYSIILCLTYAYPSVPVLSELRVLLRETELK